MNTDKQGSGSGTIQKDKLYAKPTNDSLNQEESALNKSYNPSDE